MFDTNNAGYYQSDGYIVCLFECIYIYCREHKEVYAIGVEYLKSRKSNLNFGLSDITVTSN